MKIHEIATVTGHDKADVAEACSVHQASTYWLKDVDEHVAEAYIKEFGESVGEATKKVRFWNESNSRLLPSAPEEVRGDIQFKEWAVEVDEGSPEAAFLRATEIRDRIGVREIIDKPYEDDDERVAFIEYLKSLIYTGMSKMDGPSREGRACVMAIVPKAELGELSVLHNSPDRLAGAIAKTKSMNVKFAEV